jgi:peptide/nickel transport system permease protein
MNLLSKSLADIKRYPSAFIGVLIILGLIVLSIYTIVTIPYGEAIAQWRGGETVFLDTPKNAKPVWFNLLPGVNLPETVIMNSTDEDVEKSREVLSEDMTDIIFAFPFEFDADSFPQEISVFFTAQFEEKRPAISLSWLRPDGEEVRLGDITVDGGSATYRVSQDERLQRRVGDLPIAALLAVDPEADTFVPLKGKYTLQVAGIVFEENSDFDAKMVVYGDVYGLAGTDHRRRDLMLALLWGTPIALSFGLLAAVGATFSTLIIAAIGVWFGGWVDDLIQRITEVNLILPVLSILIMIGTFYSRSIWVMLGAVIALGVFSAGIKSYRAIFLQVKESPYIEAARAYGAGNFRIIFLYMIPRIIPILVPQFVVLIPSYVFLEATLAVLGLGDPTLPTWGKVLNDARANGALYQGHYYWMLEPAVLLIITGLAFSMVGFALDRVFNPKLREV